MDSSSVTMTFFKEEAGIIVQVPRREDDLRYPAGSDAGMRRRFSASARRPSGVQTPFETLESRLLLSAIPTGGGTPPLAVQIPVASVILLEPNPVVNLTADSTLSLPQAPTPTSFSARQTMGGGPLIALVSPPVTAPVAVYTRMITVLSTTSGSLNEDSVTPVIVVATPSNQSPF